MSINDWFWRESICAFKGFFQIANSWNHFGQIAPSKNLKILLYTNNQFDTTRNLMK